MVQVSNVFAGKHGFITPRDLFKWAGRGAVGYQELAENGYLLLGERLRTPEDRAVVRQVLEKQMKVQVCYLSILQSQYSICGLQMEHSASLGKLPIAMSMNPCGHGHCCTPAPLVCLQMHSGCKLPVHLMLFDIKYKSDRGLH